MLLSHDLVGPEGRSLTLSVRRSSDLPFFFTYRNREEGTRMASKKSFSLMHYSSMDWLFRRLALDLLVDT